jgi:hypothetical protein
MMLVLPLIATIRRGQMFHLAVGVAAAIVVLLPWLLVVTRYSHDLALLSTFEAAGRLVYFPNSIDSLWARLGVFYVDTRVLARGIEAVSTPFLDAPFPIGLLLFVVFVGVQLNIKSQFLQFLVPLALILLAIAICVTPPNSPVGLNRPDEVLAHSEDGIVARVLAPIQFAYRLAGTVTLVMAVALIIAVVMHALSAGSKPLKPSLFMGVCVLISLLCIMQKNYSTYMHFVAYPRYSLKKEWLLMPKDEYKNQIYDVSKYPTTYYGKGAYSMPKLYPPVDRKILDDRQWLYVNFEELRTTQPVTCERPCALITNITSSRFNHVLVDGATSDNITVLDNGNLIVMTGAGAHEISVKPLGRLPIYIEISIGLALTWFYVSFAFFIWSFSTTVVAWLTRDRDIDSFSSL